MLEHWSLIISKPEQADLGKFKEGDFQSVTLDEAIGSPLFSPSRA